MEYTGNDHIVTGRRAFMKYVAAVVVMSAFGGMFVFAGVESEAIEVWSGRSCKGNELCQSLEGKEFDLIQYSSMGSELVILYDRDKTGDISVMSHKSTYEKGKGTVNDALRFLSSHPEYKRFRIRKGRKTLGWLKSELLEGVYVLEPVYERPSELRAARYSFIDRGQNIEAIIRPVYRLFIEDD